MPSISNSTLSIGDGKTLTPLMMNMSSVRPTTLPMRAVVRPQAQGSRVSEREVARAVAQHRRALLGQRGEHQLADLAVGDRLAGRRVEHSTMKWSSAMCMPSLHSHSPATPGPITSVRP